MRAKILALGIVFFLSNILFSVDLGPIKVEDIKTESRGMYSSVKVKITNVSGKHIKSCELSCIVHKGEEEVDVETHYVIKSTEGGLSSGDFLFFKYVFSVKRNEWNRVGFKIKSIQY